MVELLLTCRWRPRRGLDRRLVGKIREAIWREAKTHSGDGGGTRPIRCSEEATLYQHLYSALEVVP
jgi:hypothetical protein